MRMWIRFAVVYKDKEIQCEEIPMESTDFVSCTMAVAERECGWNSINATRSWIFAVDVDDDGCKGNQRLNIVQGEYDAP